MKSQTNYSDPLQSAPVAPLPAMPDDEYLIVVPSEDAYKNHEERASMEEEEIDNVEAEPVVDEEHEALHEAAWEEERKAREEGTWPE